MKTFIINLQHREERRVKIEALAKSHSLNYEIVQGVDGEHDLDQYDFKIIPGWKDPTKDRKINVGEIGCAHSHLAIWKTIVDKQLPRALILEDDIRFTESFDDMLCYVEQYLENHPETDGCYLSRNPLCDLYKLGSKDIISQKLVRPKTSYNLHSYVLTYQAAKRLIESNYENHLLPVDEFFSIMHDVAYPHKQYSKYFDSQNKLTMCALKTNVTYQYDPISSIDNASLYIDSTIWFSGQLDIDVSADQKMEYATMMNHMIRYVDHLNVNFALRPTSVGMTFIEKFIYDIAKFHCGRLHLSLDDCHVTFWTKTSPYDFKYIHTHIDHCDYEYRIENTMNIRPLFTTLTYFDENDCPTLITDVTESMKTKTQFNHCQNNKFILSFPKMLKHICFDSGRQFHGEGYLHDYDTNHPRKVLVIAVWPKSNKPLHIPYFENDLFAYYQFVRETQPIKDDIFDRDTPVVKFTNTTDQQTIIPIQQNNLINASFFEDLIIHRKKDALFPLNALLDNYQDKDTFVLDFSDLHLNPIRHPMVHGMEEWTLKPHLNKTDLFNDMEYMRATVCEERILDRPGHVEYSTLEKYVSEIARFHLLRLHLVNHPNIYVSYAIKSNVMHMDGDLNKKRPFLTLLTYFHSPQTPSIFTDADEITYKYKSLDTMSGVYIHYPPPWTTMAFDGGNYYFSHDKALVIHFWYHPPKLNVLSGTPRSFKFDATKFHVRFVPRIGVEESVTVSFKQKHECLEDFLYEPLEQVLTKWVSKTMEKTKIWFQDDIVIDVIKTNDIDKKSGNEVLKKIKFDTSTFT